MATQPQCPSHARPGVSTALRASGVSCLFLFSAEPWPSRSPAINSHPTSPAPKPSPPGYSRQLPAADSFAAPASRLRAVQHAEIHRFRGITRKGPESKAASSSSHQVLRPADLPQSQEMLDAGSRGDQKGRHLAKDFEAPRHRIICKMFELQTPANRPNQGEGRWGWGGKLSQTKHKPI